MHLLRANKSCKGMNEGAAWRIAHAPESSAGFADHVINCSLDVFILQRGIASFGRHHPDAIECMGVQRIGALGNARTPHCLVAKFRRPQDSGAVA